MRDIGSVCNKRDSGFYHGSDKEVSIHPTPKEKEKVCLGIEGCDFSFVGILVGDLLSSLWYSGTYKSKALPFGVDPKVVLNID